MKLIYTAPLVLALLFVLAGCIVQDKSTSGMKAQASASASIKEVTIDHRYVAIDNVCAWPNLTVLDDGTIIATIFNQPSHARAVGDVECWATTDGYFWEKRGTPARHEPNANRMNVAAGKANNGDLLVIASGWSLKAIEKTEDASQRYELKDVLRPWVSRSSDGGRHWNVSQQAFPAGEPGMTEFIPFGDILPGADGSLRVLAYAQSDDKATNKVSMFRSENDGKNWVQLSVISDGLGETAFSKGHNETAFFHLGEGKWIAAARRWRAGAATDLFRSADDGNTWQLDHQLTQESQHPAHLLLLNDGRLLLTYGNRVPGNFGVATKISEDRGVSWSEEVQVVNDLMVSDAGYPASVLLPDGRILTAYYAARVASHQRYHMGVAIWQLYDSPRD